MLEISYILILAFLNVFLTDSSPLVNLEGVADEGKLLARITQGDPNLLAQRLAHSENPAIYVDFHNTLLPSGAQNDNPRNWAELRHALSGVSRYADLVISSRGFEHNLADNLRDIPNLMISEGLGMRMTVGGNTFMTYEESEREFEKNKSIINRYLTNQGYADPNHSPTWYKYGTYRLDFLKTEPELSDEFKWNLYNEIKNELRSIKRLRKWNVDHKYGKSSIRFYSNSNTKLDILNLFKNLYSTKTHDFMISFGNGDIDEVVHQQMNMDNFLSVVVRQPKRGDARRSYAQYRLGDHQDVYAFLREFTRLKLEEETSRLMAQGRAAEWAGHYSNH